MVGPQETLWGLVVINNLKQPPVIRNILHFFHQFSMLIDRVFLLCPHSRITLAVARRNNSRYIKLPNNFLFPSDCHLCVSFLTALSVRESIRQRVRYAASPQPTDRDSKTPRRSSLSWLLSQDAVLLLLEARVGVWGLHSHLPRSVTPWETEIARVVTEFESRGYSAGTDEKAVSGGLLFGRSLGEEKEVQSCKKVSSREEKIGNRHEIVWRAKNGGLRWVGVGMTPGGELTCGTREGTPAQPAGLSSPKPRREQRSKKGRVSQEEQTCTLLVCAIAKKGKVSRIGSEWHFCVWSARFLYSNTTTYQ